LAAKFPENCGVAGMNAKAVVDHREMTEAFGVILPA
jgi:hypothetical protein